MRHTVCETVPSGRPDPRDPWSEGEVRMPHPHCPACRAWVEDHGTDWDQAAEFYGLTLDDDGEWTYQDGAA